MITENYIEIVCEFIKKKIIIKIHGRSYIYLQNIDLSHFNLKLVLRGVCAHFVPHKLTADQKLLMTVTDFLA